VVDLTSPTIPVAEPVGAGLPTCALPGCFDPVYVEADGTTYAFCRRSHGRAFTRAVREAETTAAQAAAGPRDPGEPAPPVERADSPPPMIVAEQAVQDRVHRQRNWMAKQLNARAEPRPCKYNGTRPCPLCSLSFRVGQELVKCYAHGGGAPPWVHVRCVNIILSGRGAPPIP